MGVLLVVMFIVFVAIGVPISFALGVVSFTGIASLGQIPNLVVFQKMFNGLNSFTLLAVPLFILAANLMNEGEITEKLIDCCNSLVGHLRGGLAYSNVLVSMIFAGISGSSQADTAGVGKIFIPAMEKQGYDKGTSVGVTAASSTLGSIIPPSITMVVYAGIANVSTGALFMSGLVPGILLGLAMMAVVKYYSKRKNFPKCERVPFKEVCRRTFQSLPALLTPIILIGGIVSGLFTPTESAAFACIYALLVGIFFYKTIKVKNLPRILIETKDPIIPENEGRWLWKLEKNGGTLERMIGLGLQTEAEGSEQAILSSSEVLEINIDELAQWIFGYRPLEEISGVAPPFWTEYVRTLRGVFLDEVV